MGTNRQEGTALFAASPGLFRKPRDPAGGALGPWDAVQGDAALVLLGHGVADHEQAEVLRADLDLGDVAPPVGAAFAVALALAHDQQFAPGGHALQRGLGAPGGVFLGLRAAVHLGAVIIAGADFEHAVADPHVEGVAVIGRDEPGLIGHAGAQLGRVGLFRTSAGTHREKQRSANDDQRRRPECEIARHVAPAILFPFCGDFTLCFLDDPFDFGAPRDLCGRSGFRSGSKVAAFGVFAAGVALGRWRAGHGRKSLRAAIRGDRLLGRGR